jgi:hypothetical protein
LIRGLMMIRKGIVVVFRFQADSVRKVLVRQEIFLHGGDLQIGTP